MPSTVERRFDGRGGVLASDQDRGFGRPGEQRLLVRVGHAGAREAGKKRHPPAAVEAVLA